jgi:hypothetical protein
MQTDHLRPESSTSSAPWRSFPVDAELHTLTGGDDVAVMPAPTADRAQRDRIGEAEGHAGRSRHRVHVDDDARSGMARRSSSETFEQVNQTLGRSHAHGQMDLARRHRITSNPARGCRSSETLLLAFIA